MVNIWQSSKYFVLHKIVRIKLSASDSCKVEHNLAEYVDRWTKKDWRLENNDRQIYNPM